MTRLVSILIAHHEFLVSAPTSVWPVEPPRSATPATRVGSGRRDTGGAR